MIRILLMVCALAAAAAGEAADPLPALHPLQVRRFAEHLKGLGRYDDALHEYRRLEYLGCGSSRVTYDMGLCHFMAGRFTEAAAILDSLAGTAVDAAVARDARNGYAAALYRSGAYDSCLAVLRRPAYAHGDMALLLRPLCLARLREWDGAAAAAEACSNAAAAGIRDAAEDMAGLCAAGGAVREKSPLLASALSLVPGLGNCYFGRYGDGFFSFLVVAGSYASAYLAYENGSNLAAAGAGGFGAVMHLGNIFGSAVSTGIVNRQRAAAPAEALEALADGKKLFAQAGFGPEGL